LVPAALLRLFITAQARKNPLNINPNPTSWSLKLNLMISA
jgi:hypothetical protein